MFFPALAKLRNSRPGGQVPRGFNADFGKKSAIGASIQAVASEPGRRPLETGFDLRRQATASYGHFGRKPCEVTLPNGEKYTAFSWEKIELLKADAKSIK